MNHSKWTNAIFVASMLLAMPVGVLAADEDAIEYRQKLMRAIDAQTAAIGQILAGTIPGDQFVSHIEVIAINAAMAARSFDAEVPGGQALPAVWKDRADFRKQMDAFAVNIAETARAGREQGMNAAVVTLVDALPCKQCHDLYRRQK